MEKDGANRASDNLWVPRGSIFHSIYFTFFFPEVTLLDRFRAIYGSILYRADLMTAWRNVESNIQH